MTPFVRAKLVAPDAGVIAVPVQTFALESLNTPTGRMLIVTDDEHHLRAVDWEDPEQRMQRLLWRHYGANMIQLREVSRPSAVRRSLQAYFDGDMDAVARLPAAANGTVFQRLVWDALRHKRMAPTP